MIELNKILRMIRSKVKDNNEITYSDYDILDAVNECIRYLNNSFALQQSDFLEKVQHYRQDDMNAAIDAYNAALPEGGQRKEHIDFTVTGADLPPDFISLVHVMRARDGYYLSPVPAIEHVDGGTYKVFANKIYCNTDFDLLYRASIAQVKDMDTDTIELPVTFFDPIIKVTCMILSNNASGDVLMQEVTRIIQNIVPKRRYSHVKCRMPFMV